MLAKTFNLQIANSYAPHVTTTIMQQFRCFAVLHPPQALDPRLLALAGLGCVNSQSLQPQVLQNVYVYVARLLSVLFALNRQP